MSVPVSENRARRRQRARRRHRPYPSLGLITGPGRLYNDNRCCKITASSSSPRTCCDTQAQTGPPCREHGFGDPRHRRSVHNIRHPGSHVLVLPNHGACYTGCYNNACTLRIHQALPSANKNRRRRRPNCNTVEERHDSPETMLSTALNIYGQKLTELSDEFRNLQLLVTAGGEKKNGSPDSEIFPEGTEPCAADAVPRIGRKGLVRIKALMGLILDKIIHKRSEELQHSPEVFDCTWPNKNNFGLYVRNPSNITNYEYVKEKLFTRGLAPAVAIVLPDNGGPQPSYEIILGAVEGVLDKFHNSKNAVPKVAEMVASVPKPLVSVFNRAFDRWLRDSDLLSTKPTGLFGRNL